MVLGVYWELFVALVLGSLIGLEREISQVRSGRGFGGFRTYAFFSLLGAISGILSEIFSPIIIVAVLSALALLSAVSYYSAFSATKNSDKLSFHMVPEISAILAFFLGLFTTIGYLSLAVTLGVVITVLLAMKFSFKKIAYNIRQEEWYSSLEFALITLVVLPLLPNIDYSLTDFGFLNTLLIAVPPLQAVLSQISVFNPYNVWLMVIFVSGISYVGYILVRFVGANRGIGLTALLGGMVSSTAVTSSLSVVSKTRKSFSNILILGVVIASAIMFVRVLFEVFVVNRFLLSSIVKPVGLMFLASVVIVAYYFFNSREPGSSHKLDFSSPFTIKPALLFGAFYVLVLFASKLLYLLFSDSGLYFASAFSGLADVDAITLTMSRLSGSGALANNTAATAITVAVFMNTLVKIGIAVTFGHPKYYKKILAAFSIIMLSGIVGIFIM